MNKLVAGIVVLLVLLVGGLFAAPMFVDFNEYKDDIAGRVKQATGRDFRIAGDIDLKLLPFPALSVNELTLGNVEGASVPEMARLKSLEVEVALLPLIGGDIQVEKIRFIEPDIVLEILPDGRQNWLFAVGEPVSKSEMDGGDGRGAAGPFNIRIDHVAVVDGRFSFVRDGVTATRVEEFDGEISAGSLNGPFRLAGTGKVGGLAVEFDAGVGELQDETPVPITANVKLAQGESRIQFNGSASEPTANAQLRGSLKAEGKSFGQAISGAMHMAGAPAVLPDLLNQPFSTRFVVQMSAHDASFNDITLKIGETLATGAVSTAFADSITIDAALKVNRIDLDGWLATARESSEEMAQRGPADTSANPDTGALRITSPDGLDGSLALEVGAVSWRDNVVRQLQLEIEAGGGVLTVKRLSALAPGGSDLSISGAVSNDETGQAAFDGRVEASSDNLRAVLQWLGQDVGAIPADRIRKLQLMATVRATPALIQVFGLDLRLDSSRIRGGLAYALRARPSFGIDFKIDRINLDAYLGHAAMSHGDAAKDGGKQADSNEAGDLGNLAFLDDFDANIKVSAGALTYRSVPAQNAELDASLIGGVLTVRNLTLGEVAGVSVGATATAGNFAGIPAAKINSVARSADLTQFFRLIDLAVPFPATALGATEAEIILDGTLSDTAFDIALKTAPIGLKTVGRLSPLDPLANLDATIDAEGEDLSRLLALFETNVPSDTPYRLSGRIKGAGPQLAVTLEGTAAGAQLRFEEDLQRTSDGGYVHSGTASISHEDVTAFVREVGVDFQPAARNLGGLSVQADHSGKNGDVSVNGLKAKVGPLEMDGTIGVRTSGVRPRIEARLQANEILADLFLPLPTTGPKGRVRSGTETRRGAPEPKERWSREPMDLAFLKSFDADISVTAPLLEAMGYSVEEPKLAIKVENGIVDIEKLNGRLFSGAFDMTVRLDANGEPNAEVDVSLQDGQLEQALMQTAGINPVTGTFSFDGRFDTHGVSQFDAINSLNGAGRLSARDGVVRGIDMRQLSDRLQSLRKLPDFLALLQTVTSRGETVLHQLDGTLSVTQGVVRSDDLTAQLDAAVGRAQGKIDLPRWLIDGAGEFSLTEHTNAPPIAVVLRGPLDNPAKSINARRLESFLISRFGTSLIRRALGAEDENQPSPAAPAAPPPAQAPVFGAPSGGSGQPQPSVPQTQPQPRAPAQSDDPLQQILRQGLKGILKQ